MRRFFVYKRKSGIYYAEFFATNGARIASRSTGTRDETEAIIRAHEWSVKGLPDRTGAPRPLPEVQDLASLIGAIRGAPLAPADARRILDTLKDKGLIEKSLPFREAGTARITVREFSAGMFEPGSVYLRHREKRGRKLSESQRRHAVSMLRAHILPTLGDVPLSDLTTERLEEFQDELLTRPAYANGRRPAGSAEERRTDRTLSPRTVNHILAILRMVTKRALKKKVIFADPFQDLEPLSQGPRKPRGIFTPEELDRLFGAGPDPWPARWARVFFKIARYSGLRTGEIQALRMGCFFERLDSQGRPFAVVRVSGSWDRTAFKAPKNGRERIAILPPSAWPEIREFLESLGKLDSADLVFEGDAPGRPVSGGRIGYAFRRALNTSGIGDSERKERRLSNHSFRYQANSELVNAGVPLVRVQALLGHVSGDEMTARYYDPGDDFQDVVAALER